MSQPPSQRPGSDQPSAPFEPSGYRPYVSPQFGDRQMGPETTRFALVDPGPSSSFGIAGALVALVGLVLGLASFLALEWTSASVGGHTFADLRKIVAQIGPDNLPGDTGMYFSWLGWTLLIGSFLLAVLACLPAPTSAALRVVGSLAGVAGIGLTLWAVKSTDTWSETFRDTGAGCYLALAGFLLIAVGAAMGPRRART